MHAALPAEFYGRPVLEVARDLVGCVVRHSGMSGLIVETEAYHDTEPASHAFAGLTPAEIGNLHDLAQRWLGGLMAVEAGEEQRS